VALAVYVGWDPRETEAYRVCVHSLRAHARIPVTIRPLRLQALREAGLYSRPTTTRDGRLWDVISDAPMSTEFAISRFFVPLLAARDEVVADWALFVDCDVLWTADVGELLAEADPARALACVQHLHAPVETVKMDGQAQLLYARKNWSSLMLFNLRHPAHARLDLGLLNGVPGRDLHRFCWLGDEDIQPLAKDWNWLEGHDLMPPAPPRVIHFTRGGPWMPGWDRVAYADLWRAAQAAAE
jgi:hypothetical protein